MKEWHYETAPDLRPPAERPGDLPPEPDLLACGARALTAVVLRCLLRVFQRFTVVGRENFPANRSFVLIANHASHLDTLCLLSALPISRLHQAFPVAAKDYFGAGSRWARFGATVVNALLLDRQCASWQSLHLCSRVLETPGNVLVLFPEGTRSAGPEPGEFKPGVALLAVGRDVPVVPCHLAGTHAALPRGAWFPRPRAVRLTIGAPRVYAHLRATPESVRHICRELREAVVSLGKAGTEGQWEVVPNRPSFNREVP